MKSFTHGPRFSGWNVLCRFLLFVLGLVAFSGLCRSFAAPPSGSDPNSPLGQWYRSLKVPGTDYGCCGLGDCRPVEARLGVNGWEIHHGQEWVPVRPQVVLNRDNPVGQAVACVNMSTETNYGESIICFVPPGES
jgi:hypothetical protein